MVRRRMWLWVLGGVGVAGLIGAGAVQAQQASAPASSAPGEAPSVEQMLAAGEQALRQHDLGLARNWFAAVLQPEPNQPHALLGMADVFRLSGTQGTLQAVEYYRQFLQIQERSGRYGELLGRAHFGLGTVYLEARHYRLAKESLERAYRLAPQDAERAVSLGLAYEGLKEYAEAVKLGEEAVRLAPQDPLIRGRLAQFYWGARNAEAAMREVGVAVEQLRGTLRAKPDDAATLHALRETRAMRLQMLQMLVREHPEDGELWFQMSQEVQEQMAVIDALTLLEALDPAEKAAQYAPQDPAVRINQARLLYQLGRVAQAEQALEAIRSAGKAGETLLLVQAQLQAAPRDAALQRIQQFLQQPTTQPATTQAAAP
jgi:Tfp pilus assembly protein PilF